MCKKKWSKQWEKEKVWKWYETQPWICGFNFLPSTAVNSTEMWQEKTFDIKTINRELGWAVKYGYNSCRIFLQYILWIKEKQDYLNRIDRFLKVAAKQGLSTMFVLFDDCAFDIKHEDPYYGKQDDPISGIHNSRWTPSPGKSIVQDEKYLPNLEGYVKGIISEFANDKRVVVWDIYNEPWGFQGRADESLVLLQNSFNWGHEENPVQPLTACMSLSSKSSTIDNANKICLNNSDIISFHNYNNLESVKEMVSKLEAKKRPLLCTEWMARTADSCFKTHLPFFSNKKIGCYQWGLVSGKSQTYYPWRSKKGSLEPNLWHHDILRSDGTPYSKEELYLVQKYTSRILK